MPRSKKKKPDMNHLTEADIVKLEIAKEIGVYDRVVKEGWRCLSAKESGKIGGILSRRSKMKQTVDIIQET